MTVFTASTEAEAVVRATRQEVWDVLKDADLIAELTPFVTGIEDHGDTWVWSMTTLPVPKTTLSPTFTEAMSFTELEHIDFTHAPPSGAQESTGVEGWYDLEEVEPEGDEEVATRLRTSLTINVDLPLPKVMAPAVQASMKTVIHQMGNRFSANLLEHLGTTAR